MTSGLSATEIRARLDHPVIDADGHIVEVAPVYEEYIAKVAGPEVRDRAVAGMKGPLRLWYDLSEEERFARHLARPPFWVHPASNSYDLATAVLPGLMRARMDEIGIDLGIVYPTFGLQVPRVADDEIRRAMCRALNLMHHELFAGHADRLIPAATIPMQTPGEALDEIGYACDELGYKVVMLQGIVRRPFLGQDGKPVPGNPVWVDPLGIDSLHDYDPLWQALVDRGIPANMHTGAMSVGMRASPSNYVLQPHRSFRLGARGLLQGAVARRRDPALSRPRLRVPGRRRRLGDDALRRPHRPLGKAQRRRHPVAEPEDHRFRAFPRALREIRRAGPSRGAGVLRREPPLVLRGRPRSGARSRGRMGRERYPRGRGLRQDLLPSFLLRLRGRRPRRRRRLRHQGQPRSAPASTRCSVRTSAIGTCPTSPACWPKPTSWSTTG